MAADNLLENPNDIEVETKDVMSKEVARNIGLRADSNVLLDGDQTEKPLFLQDANSPKSHVQTQYVFVIPNNHFGM